MENNTIPLEAFERNVRAAIARMPALAGNEIVNFALDNFKMQGFMGDSLQPWVPRKKVEKSNRALLILKGDLRRSIRITRIDPDGVGVGSSMPYAKAHNEGFKGTVTQNVKAHKRKISTVKTLGKAKDSKGTTDVRAFSRTIKQNIPARPFLKDSPNLRHRLETIFISEVLKAQNI